MCNEIKFTLGNPNIAENAPAKKSSRLFLLYKAEVIDVRGISIGGTKKAILCNTVAQIWTRFTNLFLSKKEQKIVRNKFVLLTFNSGNNNTKTVYVNVNSLMKNLQRATGSAQEKLLGSYINSKEQGAECREVFQNITSRGPLTKDDSGELMNELMSKMAKDLQKSQKRIENFSNIFQSWFSDILDLNNPRDEGILLVPIRTLYNPSEVPISKYSNLSSARMGASGTATQGAEKQKSRENWEGVDRQVALWAKNREPLTLERMNEINKGLCDGLSNNGGQAGQIRQAGENIRAGAHSYLAGADVKEQMKIFEEWLTASLKECDAGRANPVLIATHAYQRLVSIHPYHDGNGRTTRMIMDYILERYHLPPPSLDNPNIAIFGEKEENITAKDALKKIKEGIEKSCIILEIPSPFEHEIAVIT